MNKYNAAVTISTRLAPRVGCNFIVFTIESFDSFNSVAIMQRMCARVRTAADALRDRNHRRYKLTKDKTSSRSQTAGYGDGPQFFIELQYS